MVFDSSKFENRFWHFGIFFSPISTRKLLLVSINRGINHYLALQLLLSIRKLNQLRTIVSANVNVKINIYINVIGPLQQNIEQCIHFKIQKLLFCRHVLLERSIEDYVLYTQVLLDGLIFDFSKNSKIESHSILVFFVNCYLF